MDSKQLRSSFESHWRRLVKRSKRLGISPPDMEKVWALVQESYDNGFRCAYCGQKMKIKAGGRDIMSRMGVWSIDHKVPLAHGGTNEIENLAIVCHRCNIVKGTLPAYAWSVAVQAMRTHLSPEKYEDAMKMAYTGAMAEKIARSEREKIERRTRNLQEGKKK